MAGARRSLFPDRVSILLLACCVFCGTNCGPRARSSSGPEAIGNFDYYVFALSWAPAFCAHHTDTGHSHECGSGVDVGFIVHGLWPERDTGQRLENCSGVPALQMSTIQEMMPFMFDEGLIEHEWVTHGSCTGLSAADYFANIRRAADTIRIPELYRGLHTVLESTPNEVKRRFAAANRSRMSSAIQVECRGGELREVRICLTKDLQPRSCGRDERDCRGRQIFIRPIE